MRVLWFANVPTHDVWPLDRSDPACGGGWIGSLKDALLRKDPGIELAVTFPSERLTEPFTAGGVTYFPLMERQTAIPRIRDRWRHITDRASIIDASLGVVRSYRPAVVHFFGTERIFGSIIPVMGVPGAVHIQGLLTACTRMWFRGSSAVQMIRHERAVDLLLARGYLHSYVRAKKAAAREREILSACTCVLGRTDWDRRMASILAPRAKYYSCDETLRPEFWQAGWQPHAHPRKVIYATIGEAFYKGLETLLEAFRFVQERIPGNVALRIAGVDAGNRIVALSARSASYRLPSADVTFLGVLNPREIAGEMTGADVFVHPSHADNSPNSVCEAMLVGMPVVSTNAGGIPGILTDNVDGLLVQDGDPYAMAGAILDVLRNDGLAAQLSERTRARARVRHEPDRIAGRMLSVYGDLAGTPLPGSVHT